MEQIKSPNKLGYTVYSKSGCPNCNRVKSALKESTTNFSSIIIMCDDALLEDRNELMKYFTDIGIPEEKRAFPFVFFQEKYIGGYTELIKLLAQQEIDMAFH